MSFNVRDHRTYSRRTQKLVLRIQAIRDEAKKLLDIFVHEAAEGTDPQFVDTPIASAQEHIDAMEYLEDFARFHANGEVATKDRVPLLTPFSQVED